MFWGHDTRENNFRLLQVIYISLSFEVLFYFNIDSSNGQTILSFAREMLTTHCHSHINIIFYVSL